MCETGGATQTEKKKKKSFHHLKYAGLLMILKAEKTLILKLSIINIVIVINIVIQIIYFHYCFFFCLYSLIYDMDTAIEVLSIFLAEALCLNWSTFIL